MVPHWGILDIELLREKRKLVYHPAPIQKRFFNLLIDYLVIFHLAILVGFFLGTLFVITGNAELISGEQNIFKNGNVKIVMSLSIIFFYYFVCETFLKGEKHSANMPLRRKCENYQEKNHLQKIFLFVVCFALFLSNLFLFSLEKKDGMMNFQIPMLLTMNDKL